MAGAAFGLEPEVGMVALAVMAGHIWPLFWFSRRQGRGHWRGVLAGFHPLLALGAALIWAAVAFSTKISSLAAIVASFLRRFGVLVVRAGGVFWFDGGDCFVVDSAAQEEYFEFAGRDGGADRAEGKNGGGE